jgi:hypothetical protein
LEAMTRLSSQRLVLTPSPVLDPAASSSLHVPFSSVTRVCLISSRFHCSSNKMGVPLVLCMIACMWRSFSQIDGVTSFTFFSLKTSVCTFQRSFSSE